MPRKGKKAIELREKIQRSLNKVEFEIDTEKGCPWCYKVLEPGQEFCCPEHEHEYYKYNRRK